MFHRTLPATIQSGENKGEIAYRLVTNDKLGHPKDSPIKIEQSRIEYPQFGPKPETKTRIVGEGDKRREVVEEVALTEEQAKQGIEEAIADAGGAVPFLNSYNEVVRDEAIKDGLSPLRQHEGGEGIDVAKLVEAAINRIRNFTMKAAERVTVAQFRQELNAMKDLDLDTLDAETLRAKMKALLGKA